MSEFKKRIEAILNAEWHGLGDDADKSVPCTEDEKIVAIDKLFAEANARTDRAEAGCAALIKWLKACDYYARTVTEKFLLPEDGVCVSCHMEVPPSIHDPLCQLKPLMRDVRVDMYGYNADQLHPGSRFLELAQIVGGLPKLEGRIEVQRTDDEYAIIYNDGKSLFLDHLDLELADALAKLLAWRQKEQV